MSIKSFDTSDYVPKRFGICYDPPQIILEYLKPSKNKLYHHKIKMGKYSGTKTHEIIDELYNKHGSYLNNTKINKVKVIQLVEKLKDKFAKKEDAKVSDDEQIDIDPNENLNKLSDIELHKKKKEMDKIYDKNFIKKDDKNFQYDIRKDFKADENGEIWDEDEDLLI